MCAIAGIVFPRFAPSGESATVREMIRLQRHRGPDSEGYYDGEGIVLGHCRLAVIDVSAAGEQPMSDPQRRYWLTFNGEIYNYLELRCELARLGHEFFTQCDTEVLLRAYMQWEERCVTRLRGMFAFAVWDAQKRRLVAARDRLGIKPLHFWFDGPNHFAFASEIKGLLPVIGSLQLNHKLAREFLAFNLLDHEPRQTIFSNVQRLPPAHLLMWSEHTGISQTCYWRCETADTLRASPPERARLVQEFRECFEDSVSVHLRSEVPVGISLSGGLDSSSIVCMANRHDELHPPHCWRDTQSHVFCACFEAPQFDERPYIREVVECTRCQPHWIFPEARAFARDVEKWLWHQEEPVGGFGPYLQYCVARLAWQHSIQVLLDGQGADEQLAGYRKFILVYLRDLLGRGHYFEALKEVAAFLSSPELLRTCSFVAGRRYFLRSLPENELLFPDAPPKAPTALGIGYSLARRIDADLQRFSLPVLLRYGDRNTMAFGIESRVPFVDDRLVEFIARLPVEMRIGNGWTKRILREALADVLPRKIQQRKSKLNFSAPEDDWLSGPLAGWIRESLVCPRYLAEVVDPDGIRQLLIRFRAGDRSASLLQILFRLAIFEQWAGLFLGHKRRGRPADLLPPSIAVDRRGTALSGAAPSNPCTPCETPKRTQTPIAPCASSSSPTTGTLKTT